MSFTPSRPISVPAASKPILHPGETVVPNGKHAKPVEHRVDRASAEDQPRGGYWIQGVREARVGSADAPAE